MRDPRAVVVRQIVTEKTSAQEMTLGKFSFEVIREANKHEVKRAIERLFSVNVKGVRISNQRGKWRRRGRHVGRQPNWKKAVVQLAEGQSIEVEGL
ncbi:MAG: 50S ribosomal protein L23 [Gemmatimonadota bacterium]|jgi:large subunit ribosomal protein L23|nr:50S ribosomal protein L23 [Candidatus Palauibacterales bacterium]